MEVFPINVSYGEWMKNRFWIDRGTYYQYIQTYHELTLALQKNLPVVKALIAEIGAIKQPINFNN